MNSNLRHITILEEAHSILPRCSQEQNMEGSNVKGKSVEMISSAIAEMRTYGEGFIIVDQAPGAVDISAIRNTNTKIIMRLPEMDDRKVAGKSAAMNDSQIDQIAKLPTGVAAIYQNDWEAPLLCHVSMFDGERIKYNEDAKNLVKVLGHEIDMDEFAKYRGFTASKGINITGHYHLIPFVDMFYRNPVNFNVNLTYNESTNILHIFATKEILSVSKFQHFKSRLAFKMRLIES